MSQLKSGTDALLLHPDNDTNPDRRRSPADPTPGKKDKTIKPNRTLIALLAGAMLLSACRKDDTPPSEQDATVQIAVRDQKGAPVEGTPVMIFDPAGYEQFKQTRTAAPLDIALTRKGGEVGYRFSYERWFTSGARTLFFVVYVEEGGENYRMWAESLTIAPAQNGRVEIRIERDAEPATSEEAHHGDDLGARELNPGTGVRIVA